MGTPLYASVHVGDKITNKAEANPVQIAAPVANAAGTGIANSENNNLNVNGNSNDNSNLNLNSNTNRNTNRNRNDNTNIQGQGQLQGQLQGQGQAQKMKQGQDQSQAMEQGQDQSQSLTNTGVNKQSQSADNNSRQQQDQSQSANNEGNEQNVTVTHDYPVLPQVIVSPSLTNLAPGLQLNNEAMLIQSALEEIEATTGKDYTETIKHSGNGAKVVGAYNDTEATFRVFPKGSAKGVTPALMEMEVQEAAQKIGIKTLYLTGSYISIENRSKGWGASASPAGSISDAGAGNVGGIGALVTGNYGRTSQGVRIVLVYKGVFE